MIFMPCVSIDGGVGKCTAVTCVLRNPSSCEKDNNTGLLKNM